MAAKERELKAVQGRAAAVKKEIGRVRQVLEQQYDVAGVTELENDIRSKEALLAGLQESIVQMKKVGANHEKAMVQFAGEEEFADKLRQITEETRRTKLLVRETQERQKELERAAQEQHRGIVDTEERCRRLAQLLARKPARRQSEPSAQDEGELEAEVRAAQEAAKEEERRLRRQLMEADAQLEKARTELGREELRLKEKEQDIRLCELKAREVKRQLHMARK